MSQGHVSSDKHMNSRFLEQFTKGGRQSIQIHDHPSFKKIITGKDPITDKLLRESDHVDIFLHMVFCVVKY